jgi:lipopolysaccharide biosynthesis regulator YciM
VSIPLALVFLLAVGAFVAGAILAVVVAKLRASRRRPWPAGSDAGSAAAIGELYAHGVEAQRAGKQAAAVAAYQELLRLEPGHGEAHARLGEIARGRGDDQSALLHSLQALRTDDRPDTMLAAAEAYRQTGRPDDAIALYQDVIARDPGHVAALRALRDVAAAEGRWADALPAQERLVSAVGADERAAEQAWLAGIHYERGRAQVAGGDLTGGISAFRDALRVQADFVPAAVALGDAHLQAGDAAQALRVWERAVEAKPALPLLSRIEHQRREEGRPTRMIALYQGAAARQPDNHAIAVALGRVYFDLSMLDEAVEQLEKVEVRAPDLPVIHAFLGAVFERRGQLREAVDEYRRALRSLSSFEWPHRCTACGAEHAGWADRCPTCRRWNTLRP